MKIAKRMAIVLVAPGSPVVIVYIWGAQLDREHQASVSEVYPATPETVFEVLVDHEGAVNWRPSIESVEVLATVQGRQRWKETGDWGEMTYEIVDSVPPSRLVSRIADTSQGFGGTWTFELEPHHGGTRLTITEDGFVDEPLFRFLATYVFGLDTTLKDYQAALKVHLGG